MGVGFGSTGRRYGDYMQIRKHLSELPRLTGVERVNEPGRRSLEQ
jgi:hypothetical protein